MQKSSLCDTHFIVGCKLCFDGPANPVPETYNPPDSDAFTAIRHDTIPQPQPVLHPEPAPILTSRQAVTVTTASEEYAQACEKYKQACDSVLNMIDHIERMKQMLIELQAEQATAKQRRTELKKKVMESLEDED